MSRDDRHAEEAIHDDHAADASADAGNSSEPESNVLARMFGATDENDFNSYEELDAHIKRTESAAMVRLVGAPAAAMVVLLGLHLVGAQQLAIALAFPVLFIVAIFMMTANINRYQARRLKRVRDSWATE